MKDYYEILGVGRDATQDEIKKAFRKLARDTHPDANPDDPAAEARFREIAEAYEILSDPQRRAAFDRGEQFGAGDLFSNFGGLDDILQQFFGGGFGGFGGVGRRVLQFELQSRVAEQLCTQGIRGSIGDDAAAIDDKDPLADLLDLGQDVAGHQHGPSCRPELRDELALLTDSEVSINVEEIKRPEVNAQLVANSIAHQLQQRIGFRRAMKRAMQAATRAGAEGVKVQCGGRLGGAEIARTEGYHEGRVPLHTMRADIDYAERMAKTTYGTIGVKVWIYRGEVKDDRRGQTYTAGGAK